MLINVKGFLLLRIFLKIYEKVEYLHSTQWQGNSDD